MRIPLTRIKILIFGRAVCRDRVGSVLVSHWSTLASRVNRSNPVHGTLMMDLLVDLGAAALGTQVLHFNNGLHSQIYGVSLSLLEGIVLIQKMIFS